jgi:hypothetical protein
MEALEEQVDGREADKPHVHAPEHGSWKGEDFSI